MKKTSLHFALLPLLCLLPSCKPVDHPQYMVHGYWTAKQTGSRFNVGFREDGTKPIDAILKEQISGKDLHSSPSSEVPEGAFALPWPSYNINGEYVDDAVFWWEDASVVSGLTWLDCYNGRPEEVLYADYPERDGYLLFRFYCPSEKKIEMSVSILKKDKVESSDPREAIYDTGNYTSLCEICYQISDTPSK